MGETVFADKGSSAGAPAGQWQLLATRHCTAHPQDNRCSAGTPTGPQLHFPVFHRTRVRTEYAAAAEEEKRKRRTARSPTAISQRPQRTADKCTHAGHGRFACPIFSFYRAGECWARAAVSPVQGTSLPLPPLVLSFPFRPALGVSSCHCSVGSVTATQVSLRVHLLCWYTTRGRTVLFHYVCGLVLLQDIGRLQCVCVCVCIGVVIYRAGAGAYCKNMLGMGILSVRCCKSFNISHHHVSSLGKRACWGRCAGRRDCTIVCLLNDLPGTCGCP